MQKKYFFIGYFRIRKIIFAITTITNHYFLKNNDTYFILKSKRLEKREVFFRPPEKVFDVGVVFVDKIEFHFVRKADRPFFVRPLTPLFDLFLPSDHRHGSFLETLVPHLTRP